MATFLINENTFNVTNGNNTHAFDGDSAGADTLTVTVDGFLIALGINSNGARLANTLAWKVTVNGLIYSQDDDGMRLLAGNTALSTITIGVDGEVSGNGGGKGAINLESAAKVTNAGVVSGAVFGLLAQATGTTITNSGTISGTSGGSFGIVIAAAGTYTTTNSGVVSGSSAAYSDVGGANDKITNSGTMTGGLQLGEGINSVTNSGTIDFIASGDGNDTLTNSKAITDAVSLGNGTNIVNNSGTIGSNPAGNVLTTGDGNDTVTNSKEIVGNVRLAGGLNKLTNSGTIAGNVTSDGGNDTVTNTGTIAGVINLGAGNDIFTGGNSAETLRDADGSDTYKFGNGNDTYLARRLAGADGTDSVDGGAGIDTYDATGSTSNVRINLDTVDHDFASTGSPGTELVLKNTATGADVAAGLKDTVLNFENAIGGNSIDVIYGSSVANVLDGNAGNDFLFGFGGNDTLLGSGGTDELVGGLGRDTLTGGTDGVLDVYKLTALSDSTVGRGGRDQIVNFEDGFDRIHLTLIDAIAGGSDDAFTLVNADSSVNPAGIFSGVAGQLRTQATATGWLIQGDVNGDKKADFAIDIVDPTHAIVLTAADFIL